MTVRLLTLVGLGSLALMFAGCAGGQSSSSSFVPATTMAHVGSPQSLPVRALKDDVKPAIATSP
ncbi:MAG: hypothetical protein NVSMB31_09760 [Vulcanimicrobiaceae bacterium]